MFKRLSNSLLSPKEVAKYYHEPFIKTFVLLLILVVLFMVPIVLNLTTSNFLTYQNKEEIKAAFLKEEVPFKIEDGILKNVNGDSEKVYINSNYSLYKIVFTENIDNYQWSMDSILIVFCNDGVYGKMAIASKQFFKFSDSEYFKNLDFSNPDIFQDFDFWNNTFSVIQKLIDDSKVVYIAIYTCYYIIYSFIWLFVLALIVTMFSKFRIMGALKFWDLYKISIYSLTPFVICSVFSSLFGVGLLIYVGYIVSAIYNGITVNEVLKNTYSVRREGE